MWILLPSFVFALATLILYLYMSPQEMKAYEHFVLYRETVTYSFSIYGKLQTYLYHSFIFVFILQLVPIVYFGRKLVLRYDHYIREYYSNTDGKVVVWVKHILYIAFICCLISSTANYAGPAYFLNQPYLLAFFGCVMSILYYVIGYLGYRQNFTVEDLHREMHDEAEMSVAESKITLADDTLQELRRKLLFLMEDQKLFLNPKLKITDLSDILGTNRTYMSMIMNNIFHSSFSEFVNSYRIRYAKELLNRTANSSITLEKVSRKSGFTNMNSFFRSFKREENMTPAEYRKMVRKNNDIYDF